MATLRDLVAGASDEEVDEEVDEEEGGDDLRTKATRPWGEDLD